MSEIIGNASVVDPADVSMASVDPAAEPHIIIEADRTVVVPEELREIAVERDHNIETVTFDCPRYWDNHDLSEMLIFIHYRCADGTVGKYPCTSVSAAEDTIHFDWTLSQNVTCVKGHISFLVAAKKPDEAGELRNYWHSRLNSEMEVLEGLECDADDIVELYPDAIEQLLLLLDEKVSKRDIANNLSTIDASRPLSAYQGYFLAQLIRNASELAEHLYVAIYDGTPFVEIAEAYNADKACVAHSDQYGTCVLSSFNDTDGAVFTRMTEDGKVVVLRCVPEADYHFIWHNEIVEISVPGMGGGTSVEIDSTLTQAGKAADAKVVGDKIDSLSDAIADLEDKIPAGGGSTSAGMSIKTYITEDIGELYPAPSDYSAWCAGNLRWDNTLGKFVDLIYAAPAHVHTASDLHVSYIDPESYVASSPVKCKYVDTDGTTDITPDNAGTCSFLILRDGTYLMIHPVVDGTTCKLISEDNGATWKKVSAVTGYAGSPWNMTELSNGRIIISDDVAKVGFYYSDDKGINWTQTTPSTCGGNYEAEACILELEEGKLIAIARYSMSGKGYYESGDSEPAIVSFSNDYGTNWTAWEISETIDNMNASSCTGVVHDGIVEVFAASRWYSNGANINTDKANTGKNGALIHYVATVEKAMKGEFTRLGILDYANGEGGEFHSPCAAVDDRGRMLIVYMDGGETAKCNHNYIRGDLDGISYKCTEDGSSRVKAYSAATVERLLAIKQDDINYLRMALAKIEGSGVTPPSGIPTLVSQYVAADMAESLIYPWSEGSDFKDCASAGYEVSTGQTSTEHVFMQDDTGETYLKTYNLAVTPNKSDGAKDAYISVAFKGDYNLAAHVVKDGNICVMMIMGNYVRTIRTDGDYTSTKYDNLDNVPASNNTFEIHYDGYIKVGDKIVELPWISLDDYQTNHTAYTYYSYQGDVSDSNHCYFKANGYRSLYDIKYYETY